MSISVPDAADHRLLRPLPRVVGVQVEQRHLRVTLENGLEIAAPLGWYPRLEGATKAQRANYNVFPQGDVIEWPDIDEHVSVYGLLGMSD